MFDSRTICILLLGFFLILFYFSQLQSGNSKERNGILEERRIKELIEFLVKKEATAGDNIGRQSGSMAWRLERGETGKAVAVSFNLLHYFQVSNKCYSNWQKYIGLRVVQYNAII